MDQIEDPTVAGSVDYNGRPAIRSKHGKWKSSILIIGVESGERFTYYGITANLINFLTTKLGQSMAMAAANVNTWSGVGYLLPILGAIIADSYFGKYYTVIVSTIIYILGLALLSLSATLPSLNCTNHETTTINNPKCSTRLQTILVFLALYMVAIGQAGQRPCVQAFGADQFDGEHPKESRAKCSFFNWWYAGASMGSMAGILVVSYTQDNISWGLGFGIPCILMVIALLLFTGGTTTYRYTTKREGQSPFRRIGRVFMAAARNRGMPYPELRVEEEAQTTQDNIGSRQFRFLDKALIETETPGDGKACSKSEVEEAKAVLRLFPIWATSLVFAVILAQPATLFTKQGVTLDRSIGSKFKIPPAALLAFTPICIVLFIPIYDRLIVPVTRASTGQIGGISMLQRIGIGLLVSIITMVVAALVEIKRLKAVSQYGLINSPKATIPLSIGWLLPQYALLGISDAFTMVGLQEFFYNQVPDELRSVGLALYISIFGIGSLISGALVSLIDRETSKGGRHSWFSTNLNQGHLDYFYWLLAGLSAIALLLFMYFAKSYVYNKSKARDK